MYACTVEDNPLDFNMSYTYIKLGLSISSA